MYVVYIEAKYRSGIQKYEAETIVLGGNEFWHPGKVHEVLKSQENATEGAIVSRYVIFNWHRKSILGHTEVSN